MEQTKSIRKSLCKQTNVKSAQMALLHRARWNRAARGGTYDAAMEKIGK